jgi:hypothetical protein
MQARDMKTEMKTGFNSGLGMDGKPSWLKIDSEALFRQ